MSDIVERLMKVPQRVKEGFLIFWSHDYPLCREDAAEILRLRAENEKLRKENWVHIAREYTLVGMLPDETLVGEIQDARRIIGGFVDNLRAENEKLRAALKPFADLSSHWEGDKMPLEPKTITVDPLPVLYAVKELR